MNIFYKTLTLLASLLVVGCVQHSTHSAWSVLDEEYQLAIADAAVIEASEKIALESVMGESQQFVTWTAYPDSFAKDEEVALSWGELWVTLDGHVQQRCQAFPKDTIDLRIQQLLGLPPQQSEVDRFFVVLTVKTKDVFRPCANGDLDQAQCGISFPESATEAHKAWYAGQTALAYQEKGYPWTRLGYTYDWYSGAYDEAGSQSNSEVSEVGVNEFVIHRNASVKVESISPTAEYCL
jgi:hypothetical protein